MASSDPTPIAVAIVHDGDRVLIGPRPAGSALAGMWEFPGGKVAAGETPAVAAARECLEETGLAIRIDRAYPEVVHQYEHGRVRLCFFAATALDPDRVPAGQFRWVHLSELSRYEFPPANADVVRLLLGKQEGVRRDTEGTP